MKPKSDLKVAVLVPCFGRPEYTFACKKAIKEAQEYHGVKFFFPEKFGLRDVVIDFFEETRGKYDILAKIDNDCIVPKNWLNDILEIFDKSDADILSPNVHPSNAAFKHGRPGKHYMPADIIGGLWVMRAELIEDIHFERIDLPGLKGAIPLLRQIVDIKDPKMGWASNVIYQDLGHWSGEHPACIKTKEHEQYYRVVGRDIAWKAEVEDATQAVG